MCSRLLGLAVRWSACKHQPACGQSQKPCPVLTTPQAGSITMTSFISPYRADRDAVRARCSPGA